MIVKMRFLLKSAFALVVLHLTLGAAQSDGVSLKPQNKAVDLITCPNLPKLDVLPGLGYDILRGKQMAPIAAYTYKLCKTTLDGKYLIPDTAFVYPLKNSNVDLYSEIFDNYRNYTSVDSKTIQVQASYSGLFDLSASYSSEFQNVKQKQIDDNSITTRVKASYTVYKVGISNPELEPELKSAFYEVLPVLQNNDTGKVDLLLELIVSEYGTHIITAVDAGALITKEDFVLRSFFQTYQSDKHVIKAAAQVGIFSNMFNFGASYGTSTQNEVFQKYTNSTTSSNVKSFGGTLFKPNMSVDTWIDSIQYNLVSVDKSGTPLEYLITPHNFPDVPFPLLSQLQTEFSQAVGRYFSFNSHVGCMDYNSLNFDYTANVQKACTPSQNNYTFGGVFQTCNLVSDLPGYVGDLCAQKMLYQKNFLTQDYTCPVNYTAVPLKSGSFSFQNQKCEESCHGWWVFKHCGTSCRVVNSKIEYNAYFCAAIHGMQIPANTGTMFGGLFTSKIDNPMTKARSCPPLYIEAKILSDLHVCLSLDYEEGYKYSLKFGGFFSCQHGNALVEAPTDKISRLFKTRSLKSGGGVTAMPSSPKTCPQGFTQHTALIEDDCYVNYCVEAGSFRMHGELPIVLPPFSNFTEMFSMRGMKNDTSQKSSGNESTSGIGFVGIAIGMVICCGVFLTGLAISILVKRRRNFRGIPIAEFSPEETERLIQPSVNEQA